MNPAVLIPILAVIGAFVVFVLGAALMVKRFYLKVSPGQALINNKTGEEISVSFTGGLSEISGYVKDLFIKPDKIAWMSIALVIVLTIYLALLIGRAKVYKQTLND